jgi:hypothetical protein
MGRSDQTAAGGRHWRAYSDRREAEPLCLASVGIPDGGERIKPMESSNGKETEEA